MLSGLFCFHKTTCQTLTRFYHHNKVTSSLPLHMFIFHSLSIRKAFKEMRREHLYEACLKDSLQTEKNCIFIYFYMSLAAQISSSWQGRKKMDWEEQQMKCRREETQTTTVAAARNTCFCGGKLLLPQIFALSAEMETTPLAGYTVHQEGAFSSS